MSEWISVKDRLPDAHTNVMLFNNGEIEVGIYDNFFSRNPVWKTYMSYDFINYGGYTGVSIEHPEETSEVTHWMPLPDPPINREE